MGGAATHYPSLGGAEIDVCRGRPVEVGSTSICYDLNRASSLDFWTALAWPVACSIVAPMSRTVAPKFVRDQNALDDVLLRAKQLVCPRCHRAGMLVGHGFLSGYAERGNDRELRGRRLLCSARRKRTGCGRTISILIATFLAGFMVRTTAIFALLEGIVGGLSCKAAWERVQHPAENGLTLRSGYRLWSRLMTGQSRVRAALHDVALPPSTNDARPVAQMLDHLRHALRPSDCAFASFQVELQQGVFG